MLIERTSTCAEILLKDMQIVRRLITVREILYYSENVLKCIRRCIDLKGKQFNNHEHEDWI